MNAVSQCHDLMNRKDEIENEIKAIIRFLESQGVGVTGPLIDSEGFPLNNVDLFSIREARLKHNCLQNDLRAIMLDIESKLHEIHALNIRTEANNPIDNSGEIVHTETGNDGSAIFIARHPPFARVSRVDQASVADQCGLRVGDELLQLDSVTKETFTDLPAIMELLRSRANKMVLVCVKRCNKRVHLTIVPPLTGPIGCMLVPI